jgi:hypothetical protein
MVLCLCVCLELIITSFGSLHVAGMKIPPLFQKGGIFAEGMGLLRFQRYLLIMMVFPTSIFCLPLPSNVVCCLC